MATISPARISATSSHSTETTSIRCSASTSVRPPARSARSAATPRRRCSGRAPRWARPAAARAVAAAARARSPPAAAGRRRAPPRFRRSSSRSPGNSSITSNSGPSAVLLTSAARRFSATVRSGNSRRPCGTSARPWRRGGGRAGAQIDAEAAHVPARRQQAHDARDEARLADAVAADEADGAALRQPRRLARTTGTRRAARPAPARAQADRRPTGPLRRGRSRRRGELPAQSTCAPVPR